MVSCEGKTPFGDATGPTNEIFGMPRNGFISICDGGFPSLRQDFDNLLRLCRSTNLIYLYSAEGAMRLMLRWLAAMNLSRLRERLG